jgi:hypothetical protein
LLRHFGLFRSGLPGDSGGMPAVSTDPLARSGELAL